MLQSNQLSNSSSAIDECRYAVHRRMADVRLHGARQIVTSLSGPDAADRHELEDFVRSVFRRAHGAEIRHFMPQLMSLRNERGELLAVCGLRHAAGEQLFLEQYLDAPVETVLSQRTGKPVLRQQVIETGNLAVAEPSSVRCLLASVSVYLHGTSAEWAVFTGIPALRNSLTKLNMQLEILGEARITDLPGHERADWGSYYDERPLVMAVRRMQ